jgi:glycerol-3-phosphate dehydrogenase (NAD(P)+)
MTFSSIAVIGAGAWGSALANVIARNGLPVTLVTRTRTSATAILRDRESPYLPGIRIDPRVQIVPSGPDDGRHDAILLAVPSQQIRLATTMIASGLAAGTPVVVCAKGIERGSRKFMTDVVREAAQHAMPAVLSGPSFAADVARGLPTAVTLAAPDAVVAAALARTLASATFRPYHTTDVRGVEIGGAAKNVLAIAAGIVSGRGLGASAGAALITRGFAELARFGKAYGARPETLTGLSGLGDLVLTCGSAQSRNFSLGVLLGKGETPARAAAASKLAEGTFTAATLVDMARERGVDMPIASAVTDILDGRLKVDVAIETLLTRPLRAEE